MGVGEAGAQPGREDSSDLSEERGPDDDPAAACVVDKLAKMSNEQIDRFLMGDIGGRAGRLARLGVSGAMAGPNAAVGIGRKLVGAETREPPGAGAERA